MSEIEPFRVAVPEPELEDLRARLAATRWPPAEPVADWSQGVPRAYLRELCEHWRTEYDWRQVEARLNALPQFRTAIDGVGIHFIHLRSSHEGALPLILTHGWPGSVLEFLEAIERLVDPTAHGGEAADAFHVVIPALPGYGFSDAPTEIGWGPDRVSRAWAQLMSRLGYERYGAQGGDWGSAVTRGLARNDAEHVVGIHLNTDHVPRGTVERLGAATEFEREALAERNRFGKVGTGYMRQQATRPQTLGYALADSPAGQCAWIVEKFAAWSDCGGEPERAFSRATLLDNVSLYWLTGSAATSARMYWEAGREGPVVWARGAGVPTAVSVFPHDINLASERWLADQETNLVYHRLVERGGHFAALEVPELFVAEVRAAFRAIAAA